MYDPDISLGEEGRRRREQSNQRRQHRQQKRAENQRREEEQAQERATTRAENQRQKTQDRFNHIQAKTALQLVPFYQAGDKKEQFERKLRHLENRSPEFVELASSNHPVYCGFTRFTCGCSY